MYDETSGYYYLFVSYGALTSNGGYQVRVFRSKTVDGEYVDMNGKYPEKSAQHQNFGLKLTGNYKLPSLEKHIWQRGIIRPLWMTTAGCIWFIIPDLTTMERVIHREYIRCL